MTGRVAPRAFVMLALSSAAGIGCSVQLVGAPSTDTGPSGAGATLGTEPIGTPRAECVSATYKSQLLPASILFIVDRSGTMLCNPTTPPAMCESNPVTLDTTQPTKWGIIVASLSRALASVQETR